MAPQRTTTGAAAADFPALLVAGPGGVEIVAAGGRTVLWEGAARAAYPDGSGGALVDPDDGAGFWWDADLERYVLRPADTAGVMQVDAAGRETVFLANTSAGVHRLVGVADVAGRPTAVLWRTVVGPPCCDGDPDAAQVEFASIRTLLVLVDVATGAETTYGVVAGYETDLTVASFGGDVVALGTHEYAGGMGPLWWGPLRLFAEVDTATIASGNIPWIEASCLDGACAIAGPVAPCEAEGTCWNVMRTPSVARDGSAVAYVEAFEGTGLSGNPEVVAVDLPSGSERWRASLDVARPGSYVWAAAVDFDGETVLVSLDSPTQMAVLVGAAGELGRRPVDGVAVRWRDGN